MECSEELEGAELNPLAEQVQQLFAYGIAAAALAVSNGNWP
jgi:hypothetical protein